MSAKPSIVPAVARLTLVIIVSLFSGTAFAGMKTAPMNARYFFNDLPALPEDVKSCFELNALPGYWEIYPDDAKDEPPSIQYDPLNVPPGVDETSLELFRLTSRGDLERLETVIDPVAHRASTPVLTYPSTVILSVPCPLLEVTPTSVFFPSVAAGDTVCASIRLRNIGGGTLTLSGVTGCDADGFFANAGSLPATLASGDSTRFPLCFTPRSAAAPSCTLSVLSPQGTIRVTVSVGSVSAVPTVESRDRLSAGAYPNPFTRSVRIEYAATASDPPGVTILDVTGRRVRSLSNSSISAGRRQIIWDGRDDSGRAAPGGIYFLRLESAGSARVLRLLKSN